MDIILQGLHTSKETVDTLNNVLKLFKERYAIEGYREIHVTMTLVDKEGNDVELVDTNTAEVYRYFEVFRSKQDLKAKANSSKLKLVIDNTREQ